MSLPTERVEVDSKGRVVIPSRFRKSLGIKPGDTIEFFFYRNNLVLRSLLPQPVKAVCLNCGKIEGEVDMQVLSSDGHYGVCKTCHKGGFKFMEVNIANE